MPKVSVIMPVYNTKEEYLREALESILNQSYTDFELIIINDGSENNAEDVILSYKDERIKYFRQEKRGASAARNKGIRSASGEYIAIADSDDMFYSERLARMVCYMDENPEVSFLGSWMKINGKIHKAPVDIRIMDLLADCCINNPIIRKADLEKYNLYYDETLICAEDYDLYARAIKYLKMANLPEVLYFYRIYNTNTSTSNKDKRIVSSFKVQEKLLDYISTDKRIRDKITNIAYLEKNKTSNLREKIFSIKNLYKSWKKYKMITVLGIEFLIPVGKYRDA